MGSAAWERQRDAEYYAAMGRGFDMARELRLAEEEKWQVELADRVTKTGRLQPWDSARGAQWWHLYDPPSAQNLRAELAGTIYHGPEDIVYGGPMVTRWSYYRCPGAVSRAGGTAASVEAAVVAIDARRQVQP